MDSEARAALIVEAKTEAAENSLKRLAEASTQASGSVKEAGESAQGAGTNFNSLAQSIAPQITQWLTLTGAVLGTVAVLKESINAAAESETVNAQLDAIIRAQGTAAKVTGGQIRGLASEIQRTTQYGDEAVVSLNQTLLTMGQFSGDTLKSATTAIIDMSAALGRDLQSSAFMVGRALADPISGMTMLRRAGVIFTADQKEVIKSFVDTGQAAKAQDYILAELNKRFSGSAAAQLNTYAGQMTNLKDIFGEVAEMVGNKLLPGLTRAAGGAHDLLAIFMEYPAILREHGLAIQTTTDSFEEYRNEFIRTQIPAREFFILQAKGVKDLSANGDAVQGLLEKYGALTDAEWESAKAFEKMAFDSGRAKDSLVGLTPVVDASTSTIDLNSIAVANLNAAMGAQEGNQAFAASQEELAAKIADTTAEIQKYQDANGQTITVVNEATVSADEYTLAQTGVTKAGWKWGEAQKKLNERLDDTDLFSLTEDVLQAKIAFDNAQQKVGDFHDKLGSVDTFAANYKGKIGELETDLTGLQGAYDANAAAHEAATHRILFGILEQRLATNDLKTDNSDYTAAELELLNKVAVGWGLVDQGTSDAIGTMDTVLANFASGEASPANAATAIKRIGTAAGGTGPDDMPTGLETGKTKLGELARAADEDLKQATEHGTQHIQKIAGVIGGDDERGLPKNVDIGVIKIKELGDSFQFQVDPLGPLYNYHVGLDDVTALIGALPSEVRTDYWFVTHGMPGGDTPPPPGGGDVPPPGASGARGLDMIVPPGFSRDNYPIRASSGERVTIRTRGQQMADENGGKGGVYFYAPVYVTEPVTGAWFRDMLNRETGVG